MAISDAEYTAWLLDESALRCVLVQAVVNSGGSEVTRYMSNRGYVTGASDSPANTSYSAVIAGGVKLTESLSLSSGASLSWGEIEIHNKDGEFDSWLLDVWNNRAITVYYGDMRWVRSDFRKVFAGYSETLKSQRRDKLNLLMRDSLQRLNTPITDVKLGGSTTNKDSLIPLCFGEAHNVSPLLIDPVLHDYQVHNGAIEGVIEVRDNGAPITVTTTVATGKFRLAEAPEGTITCSVQGSKPSTYSNLISDTIKYLVKTYGNATNRLTDSDIDLTNFSTFAAANTAPIGLYLSERTNLLDACQQLAGSVGAQVTMSRAGLLTLQRIDFPPVGTPRVINSSHMKENTLSVDSRLDVQPSIKIGYNKNYTVEGSIQTVIPEEHKKLFGEEWLTTTQVDSAVATKYRTLVEPVQVDTLLQTTSTADAEATRRLLISKQQRTVYQFTGFADMLDMTLGQAVTLTHSRFGLSGGVLGVVVGVEPDWIKAQVIVKVMI